MAGDPDTYAGDDLVRCLHVDYAHEERIGMPAPESRTSSISRRTPESAMKIQFARYYLESVSGPVARLP